MSHLDDIKTFEFLSPIVTPDCQFIPKTEGARKIMYSSFMDSGITLPPYDSFTRRFLRRADMMVLNKGLEIRFRYKNQEYKMIFARGTCWDGASIPNVFVFGNASKFNQYVILASLVHDALFALHLMPYDDANNIFSAIMRAQGINKLALGRFMLGVRSRIGRRMYRRSNPDKHWMKGFVNLEKL